VLAHSAFTSARVKNAQVHAFNVRQLEGIVFNPTERSVLKQKGLQNN